MKIHLLKTDEKPFEALRTGKKTFEFRKNDRDYRIHDVLCLTNNENENEVLFFLVTHILLGPNYGMPEEYCCMPIRALSRLDLRTVLQKDNTVTSSEPA